MPIERVLAATFVYDCTMEEIIETLMIARVMVKDWTERSVVNRSMSRGAFYNMMSASIGNTITSCSILSSKRNIILEFGEYMPSYERRIAAIAGTSLYHEEPNELDLSQFIVKLPEIKRIR